MAKSQLGAIPLIFLLYPRAPIMLASLVPCPISSLLSTIAYGSPPSTLLLIALFMSSLVNMDPT